MKQINLGVILIALTCCDSQKDKRETISTETGGTETNFTSGGNNKTGGNETGGTNAGGRYNTTEPNIGGNPPKKDSGTDGNTTPDSGTPKKDSEPNVNMQKDSGTGGIKNEVRDSNIDNNEIKDSEKDSKDTNIPDTTDGTSENCTDGFPRGTVSTLKLVSKFTPSPEGVTVCPGGDIFISIPNTNNSEIKRIPPGSAPEHWTTIQGSQTDGITCDYKRRLFVGQYGGTPTPSAIIMVTGKDDPGTRLPSPNGTELSLINGVIAVTGHGVYASDTTNNLIVRTDDIKGSFETTIVATDISQPNGLSYNPVNKTLYVGMSLNDTIGSFEVKEDGSLGTFKEVWKGPDLIGFVDGTAVDGQGGLYAANWLSGKLVRAADNKVLTDVLTNPASMAWRGGMLFVTDFKLSPEEEGGLYAMNLGICGPTVW